MRSHCVKRISIACCVELAPLSKFPEFGRHVSLAGIVVSRSVFELSVDEMANSLNDTATVMMVVLCLETNIQLKMMNSTIIIPGRRVS